MRALDGPLLRRAQQMLGDSSALVLMITVHTGAEHPRRLAPLYGCERAGNAPMRPLSVLYRSEYGAELDERDGPELRV
mgnify:FL=1